ncbi:hypothetical protein NPIL_229981 [Nephila pilipes]|uniref:Uncharacterized protein n=1 Tax=Nephila pilipes TaxID=299642 RepID=A0A8X6MMG1_NEPPI|nr:hypothetical protein NPIL_229981 [Nephila pilipes]
MARTEQTVCKKNMNKQTIWNSTDLENNPVEELDTMETAQDDTYNQNVENQDGCLMKTRLEENFLVAINYYHYYCAMSNKISMVNAVIYGDNQNKLIEFHRLKNDTVEELNKIPSPNHCESPLDIRDLESLIQNPYYSDDLCVMLESRLNPLKQDFKYSLKIAKLPRKENNFPLLISNPFIAITKVTVVN